MKETVRMREIRVLTNEEEKRRRKATEITIRTARLAITVLQFR